MPKRISAESPVGIAAVSPLLAHMALSAPAAPENAVVQQSSKAAKQQTRRPANRAPRPARSPPTTPPPSEDGSEPSLEELRRVWLAETNRPSSYRYSQAEADWLKDAVYLLERDLGLGVSKQDIVRVGVLLARLDLEQHGEQSAIARLARGRKGQPG